MHYKLFYILKLFPLLLYYQMIYTIPSELKGMIDKDSDFDLMAFEDIFKVAHAMFIVLLYIWLVYKVFRCCKFKKVFYFGCLFWITVIFLFIKIKVLNSCQYLDIDLDTYYNYYNPVMKDKYLHRNPNPVKYNFITKDGTCEWKKPRFCWHFALDGYAKIFYLEDQTCEGERQKHRFNYKWFNKLRREGPKGMTHTVIAMPDIIKTPDFRNRHTIAYVMYFQYKILS